MQTIYEGGNIIENKTLPGPFPTPAAPTWKKPALVIEKIQL